MGRFPWNQGHSKQGGDKLYNVAHDWFSKEQAEPSRQALNDLMKESSNPDDVSPKTRGRSRTNTVTSSFSVYARSMSDASNDLTSRPPSQQSFVDGGMPLPERHESTAKALLARGTRLLKRQGSKLNLLPSQVEDRSNDSVKIKAGEQSPGSGLQRQPTLISRRQCSLLVMSCSPKLTVSRYRHEAQHIWTIRISAPDPWRPGPFPKPRHSQQDRSDVRVQRSPV